MAVSFGVPRNKCVGANHADKTPDKIVPGPGSYHRDILSSSKRTNYKCGSIGFASEKSIKSYGRPEKGGINELALTRKYIPAPNQYQSYTDITSLSSKILK